MSHREEVINRRIERIRSKQKTKVVFTPFPISVVGPLTYMFPARGKVARIIVHAAETPKSGIDITVKIDTVKSSGVDISAKFHANDIFITEPTEVGEVDVGEILSIKAEATNPNEEIGIYWIAVLWVPHKSEGDVMKLLTSELEKDNNKET